MKNFKFFFVAFMLLAASCSNDGSLDSSVNHSDEQGLAPVTVRVNEFSVEQGAFPTTRATAVASYSGVKFLTLAFYASNGTEVFKVTHEKDNMAEGQTFGEFSTTLPMGSYTMVVVGNGSNNAITLNSATSATYGENKPWDTFAATQTVSVTDNTAKELTATLDRVVSAVAVQSTDNRTADVANLRVTTSAGGNGFNPTTGLATSNTGVTAVITPSSAVGSTTYVGAYLFLATDEQTVDVTVETLDADNNVLFSKTVENVPLKRNRITRLTGALYGAGATAGSFQVNTDWLSEHDMDL